LKTFVEIDKTSGQLASGKTPPENKEMQEHQIILDPLGTPFCLDCPFPTEPITINPATLSTSMATPSSNQP